MWGIVFCSFFDNILSWIAKSLKIDNLLALLSIFYTFPEIFLQWRKSFLWAVETRRNWFLGSFILNVGNVTISLQFKFLFDIIFLYLPNTKALISILYQCLWILMLLIRSSSNSKWTNALNWIYISCKLAILLLIKLVPFSLIKRRITKAL